MRAARHQVARLGEIVRDRLVADDVEPRVERRGGERVVRVVRRHDRHGVGAVRGARARPRSSRRRWCSCGPARNPAQPRLPPHGPGRRRTRRPPGSHQPSSDAAARCMRPIHEVGPPPISARRSRRPKRDFRSIMTPPAGPPNAESGPVTDSAPMLGDFTIGPDISRPDGGGDRLSQSVTGNRRGPASHGFWIQSMRASSRRGRWPP